MTKKQIKIGLASGLEARPIAMLVQIASQFESSIYVDIGNKRVNAKSIMGMMTIAMDTGDEITISADGPDEETAMAEIGKYLRGDN
ncbi:MAG: HPr family phosphocarrier protein [Clostridiales bacterium]|nr:HPr family phosphocarrier protein [Clostridiales bacterium]